MSYHFNKEQIEQGEYKKLDPTRFSFQWNEDYTECEAIPLPYWDDVSYRRYQCYDDNGDDDAAAFFG